MSCEVVATVQNSSVVASIQTGKPTALVSCPQGTQGPAGYTTEWRTGTGVPPGVLGAIGDFYIDLNNGDFYKKTGAATWVLQGNFGTFLIISGLTDLPLTDIALNDQLLIRDISASLNKRIDFSSILKSRRTIQSVSREIDFTGSTLDYFGTTNSGAGASSQSGSYGVDAVEKALGVREMDTGSTAAGRSCIHSELDAMSSGYAELYCCWRVAIPTLSTVGETFTCYAGFGDNNAAGDGVDAAYFRYTDGVFGGRWQCVCRSNSSETVVDSGVLVPITYQKLEVVIAEDASNVRFFIDGVLVATITTNIPLGAARAFGFLAKIQKSIGTALRTFNADYAQLTMTYPGER